MKYSSWWWTQISLWIFAAFMLMQSKTQELFKFTLIQPLIIIKNKDKGGRTTSSKVMWLLWQSRLNGSRGPSDMWMTLGGRGSEDEVCVEAPPHHSAPSSGVIMWQESFQSSHTVAQRDEVQLSFLPLANPISRSIDRGNILEILQLQQQSDLKYDDTLVYCVTKVYLDPSWCSRRQPKQILFQKRLFFFLRSFETHQHENHPFLLIFHRCHVCSRWILATFHCE